MLRGSGDPRHSRPGGQRYKFVDAPHGRCGFTAQINSELGSATPRQPFSDGACISRARGLVHGLRNSMGVSGCSG